MQTRLKSVILFIVSNYT